MSTVRNRMQQLGAHLPLAIRLVSHFIIVLIIVQAITGLLLSLHYVPDAHPAHVHGQPATITHARTTIVGGFDTLALAGEHALVPADADDIVPSVAASSVSLTIEHHVVGGSIIRGVHHGNTTILILLALILFVLLIAQRAWRGHSLIWIVTAIGLVVLLAAAFTGRLLPDDVYANVSSSIVRHELSEFPFGSSLVTMLGLSASNVSRLSTPYAIHALFLPCALAIGVCLLWRRIGRPTVRVVMFAAVYIAFIASLSMPYYPVHDVRGATAPSMSVTPWWPFVVPNALVSWLGSELAGYLTFAVLLVLVTLPLWNRRKS